MTRRWVCRLAAASLVASSLLGSLPVIATANGELPVEDPAPELTRGSDDSVLITDELKTGSTAVIGGSSSALVAPAGSAMKATAAVEKEMKNRLPDFGVSGYCKVTVIDSSTGATSRWPGCEPGSPSVRRPADAANREAVIRAAVQHLLVEPGEIGVLPGRALTGLETFFWVDGVGLRVTPPDEGPFGMEIRAWPVAYRWEFGDGRSSSSDGPGNPDTPRSSEISHVYERGGRLEARVVVTWEGSASSVAGTQPVPGPFTTTATAPVQVDQIRARLVG
jgi:hypothetical protein